MNASALPSTGLRLSHAVVAVAALHQILGSEWMEPPWEEDASGVARFLFEAHEWTGLAAAAALIVLVVSMVRRYGADFREHLAPWSTARGRQGLRTQARAVLEGLRTRTIPPAASVSILAAAWQGLGLATIAFMAVTGSAMAWLESPDLMEEIADIHELGAAPLQVYVAGHAVMALIHELRGEGVLRRMLPWSRASAKGGV